jgi:cysteine desulfurase
MLYADYNATAPLLPSVKEVMEPFFGEYFANPSSSYPLGRFARNAIEQARENVSKLVNCHHEQVVFLSSGTESCFSALVGSVKRDFSKKHIIASCVEHPAVLETLSFLAEPHFQCRTSFVPVNSRGGLLLEDFLTILSDNVQIATIMHANNETGVLFPVNNISQLCRERGVVFHTDATQAVGRIEVDFKKIGCHFMSFSAHKMGGPKGVGALIVESDDIWEGVMVGGGQENGRRGGTYSVAEIVGFGEACKYVAEQLRRDYSNSLKEIRDYFETKVLEIIPNVHIHGQSELRLPNTSSLVIEGISGTNLVKTLGEQDIMISTGSACSSDKLTPSHVLRAMGLSVLSCLGTLRVSFGHNSSKEEAGKLAQILDRVVSLFRQEVLDSSA